MTRHVLLDNVTHKDLRVDKAYRKGAGYDVNLARVFPVEFVHLQREYPLFFVRNTEGGHFEPIALLGFSEAENLFLSEAGWVADYIPLSIQRQPLLIGFQEQLVGGVPTEVPVVHIDLDHPSVSETEGEPLFLAHGGESPWLERMSSILKTIHEGHEVNQAFSQLLVGLELIESLVLEIELKDGSKHTVKGLYAINETRLNALSANGLEVLHRKGHLKDLFLMQASLANLDRVIEMKNRLLVA